jgi:hypothetical protein
LEACAGARGLWGQWRRVTRAARAAGERSRAGTRVCAHLAALPCVQPVCGAGGRGTAVLRDGVGDQSVQQHGCGTAPPVCARPPRAARAPRDLPACFRAGAWLQKIASTHGTAPPRPWGARPCGRRQMPRAGGDWTRADGGLSPGDSYLAGCAPRAARPAAARGSGAKPRQNHAARGRTRGPGAGGPPGAARRRGRGSASRDRGAVRAGNRRPRRGSGP